MTTPPSFTLTHTESIEQMLEDLPDIPVDSVAFKSLMEAEDPLFVAMCQRIVWSGRFSSTHHNTSNIPKGL